MSIMLLYTNTRLQAHCICNLVINCYTAMLQVLLYEYKVHGKVL